MKIVLPSTFQAYFQGSQVPQKASQIGPTTNPETAKCQKMTQPKKRQKNDRQQVVKNTDFVSKIDEVSVAETFPQSQQIQKK